MWTTGCIQLVLHLSGVGAVREVGGGVGGLGGGVHANPPERWSCLKPPRLDKPHQKRISPLFSPSAPPSPSPQPSLLTSPTVV